MPVVVVSVSMSDFITAPVIVVRVVVVLPLLIDREVGLSGERAGKGGEPGGDWGEVRSHKVTFWRLWRLKPGGGLAMPTRRERGTSLENPRVNSPADNIVEISSMVCSVFEQRKPAETPR